MKSLILLLFCFSLIFVSGQKVHSIYVLTTKEKFSNSFQDFTKRDSIVLYKDSTFRRENNYWGFDEIEKNIFRGKWMISKELLILKVEKREDSSKVKNLESNFIIQIKDLKREYKKIK